MGKNDQAVKRVLSVGQCAADHFAISRAIERHFPAEVAEASTTAEATAQLREGQFALVLVNRIFDRDGTSGLDVIRRLKADDALHGVPVMLVSNYDEAQQQAVTAGAAPGFGKSALGQPSMLARLKEFLS
jgi:two-component system chemotaxis response regulator CheY